MAIVYSYLRFSSKKQERGDSERRQTDWAQEWVQKNDHTLASLSLKDMGVSAFRGKNRTSGALGTFLEAIVSGRVKPGSILLVEQLDRLSREGVGEALALFQQILKAGVTIVTLKPQEQTYTRKSLDDIVGLLIPILAFHLAHLESLGKRNRLGAYRKNLRDKAVGAKRIDAFAPAWCSLDPKTDNWVENEGAEAIRYAFKRTCEGVGQRVVTKELQARYKPIGKSGKWTTSYLALILADRRVLGERQHYTFTAEGERVPVGDPVKGYYPALVSEDVFLAAALQKKKNLKKRGPNSMFVNLFTGLVYNAIDKSVCHVTAMRREGESYHRRLTSYAHLQAQEGACPISIPLDSFEQHLLVALRELKASDLARPTPEAGLLEEKVQALEGVEERIKELENTLQESSGKTSVKAILNALEGLEERRVALLEEVERLRAESDVPPVGEAQELVVFLDGITDSEELRSVRLRLRGLIGELVERIWVRPEKLFGRIFAVGQINYRGGFRRTFLMGPEFPHRNNRPYYLMNAMWDAEGDPLDGLAKEGSEKINYGLHDFARTWLGLPYFPEEDKPNPLPKEIPADLRGAFDYWVRSRKESATPGTLKDLKIKIKPFLDLFAEGDVYLTATHWRLFTNHLRLAVAEGRTAPVTARVTYARSREFCRWLEEQGRAATGDSLKVSAAKALS